jgi:hypothetical protein
MLRRIFQRKSTAWKFQGVIFKDGIIQGNLVFRGGRKFSMKGEPDFMVLLDKP